MNCGNVFYLTSSGDARYTSQIDTHLSKGAKRLAFVLQVLHNPADWTGCSLAIVISRYAT